MLSRFVSLSGTFKLLLWVACVATVASAQPNAPDAGSDILREVFVGRTAADLVLRLTLYLTAGSSVIAGSIRRGYPDLDMLPPSQTRGVRMVLGGLEVIALYATQHRVAFPHPPAEMPQAAGTVKTTEAVSVTTVAKT